MEATHVEACCESGHRQIMKVDASLGREYAESLAGLLDGTSPLYLYPPGEDSCIGKCGICGKKITCTILGYDIPAPGEEARTKAAAILNEMEAETPLGNPSSGLRCPKCGAVMVHYRLKGYQCPRCN